VDDIQNMEKDLQDLIYHLHGIPRAFPTNLEW
jgi:hypothetical protein